jgi:hypothetical protein
MAVRQPSVQFADIVVVQFPFQFQDLNARLKHLINIVRNLFAPLFVFISYISAAARK